MELCDFISGQFLSVSKASPGDQRGQTALSPGGSSSYFKLVAGSKARRDGDPVFVRDSVVLLNISTSLYLDVSDKQVPYYGNARELGATGNSNCLFQVLRHSTATAPNILSDGDPIFLAHGEYDGYITNDVLASRQAELP